LAGGPVSHEEAVVPEPSGEAAEQAANRVLRHPTRLALYRLVRQNWGICETDLAKLSALGRNNVKYHLQRLVRARMVQPQPIGRKVHYFPRDVRTLELQRAIVSAQNGTRRQILQLVRHHPELSWRAIGRIVSITPRAVRWHMKQLSAFGLVDIERDGMYCRARLSPILMAVLDGDIAELAKGVPDIFLAPAPARRPESTPAVDPIGLLEPAT
jgi:DNA-binding transcriptional ArsR family regulator